MANIIERVFNDPYIIKQLKNDPSMLTYFTNKPPASVTQNDLAAKKMTIINYYAVKKIQGQQANQYTAVYNQTQLRRRLTLPHNGSTSRVPQYNGPNDAAKADAVAASAKAAQNALIPNTPRKTQPPPSANNGINAGRKNPCNGVGCSVMGGRRKTRRRTRRAKSRRVRRS